MFKCNVKILGNTVTQFAPNISNRILKKKKEMAVPVKYFGNSCKLLEIPKIKT